MLQNRSTRRSRRNHFQSNDISIVQIEAMEERHLLATFGIPWPEARNLSVSFPTDETTSVLQQFTTNRPGSGC